jgi:hypothetical protein
MRHEKQKKKTKKAGVKKKKTGILSHSTHERLFKRRQPRNSTYSAGNIFQFRPSRHFFSASLIAYDHPFFMILGRCSPLLPSCS